MGRSSRDKGGRGEREVIALLQPIVDRCCTTCGQPRFELHREGRQRYERKHYDIDGLPWLAMEVKRVENPSGKEAWWRQTLAATREGQIPILLHRENHGKWKVRMRVPIAISRATRVRMTVDVTFADFCVWLEQELLHRLRR